MTAVALTFEKSSCATDRRHKRRATPSPSCRPAINFKVLEFLNSLVIFPPDDTASNLDPGNRHANGFPQFEHGSVKLTALFNNPSDIE